MVFVSGRLNYTFALKKDQKIAPIKLRSFILIIVQKKKKIIISTVKTMLGCLKVTMEHSNKIPDGRIEIYAQLRGTMRWFFV